MKCRPERIASLDDARVAPYRNLRERTLRGENLFIAESLLLVERLLRSDYEVDSLLVTEEALEAVSPLLEDETPVYVTTPDLMRAIVGFQFHRGALAVGRRRPGLSLEDLLGKKRQEESVRLVVLPQVGQSENLGLIARSAAAFGVDGLVLGPGSCDPLSRRALRLSMGGVLRVPLVRLENLAQGLRQLHERWNVELVATVLDEDAERLDRFRFARRTGLVLGNEYDGLDEPTLALCQRRVTIAMRPGTDSLNLGVATGVFLHEMCVRG